MDNVLRPENEMSANQTDKLAQLELFSKNNLFVYLTSLYVIIWYLQLGVRVSFFGAIRFEFLLGAFLGLVALIYQLQNKSPTAGLTKYVYWFFFVLIIQIPLSVAIEHSFNVFIDRVVKFSLLSFFISTLIRTPQALKVFIFAYLLACFRLGFEGFLGWRSGGLVWENQGIMRLHGSIPILAHPNSFSGFGVCLLPFIYYLFPNVNKLLKVFLGILLVFSIVIIIFTGSRAGYLAAFGFLAFATYQSKYRAKVAASFILLLIFSFPFIPDQYKERFESIYSGKQVEGNSKIARIAILSDALEISMRNPFGVGVAAFPIIREQYFGRKQDTHNLYFEVLTNLGIQGLIIFILLILKIFKSINTHETSLLNNRIKLSRAPPETPLNKNLTIKEVINQIDFCISIGKAIKGFIAVRLFLGMFGMDLYEIYWWLAIGLTLSIRTISQSVDKFTKIFSKQAYSQTLS